MHGMLSSDPVGAGAAATAVSRRGGALATASLAFGILVAIAACSDDGSPQGGGGAAAEPCVEGAELVAQVDALSGSVPDLAIAGAEVYFNTVDAVGRVPRSGGEVEVVFRSTASAPQYPPFWIVESRLVVGKGDAVEDFTSIGAPSGATKQLPEPYSFTAAGRANIVLDQEAATLFARRDGAEAANAVYFSFDLRSDVGVVIEETPDHQAARRMVRAGGHLFVARDPCDGEPCGEPPGDLLSRVDVEGGFSEDVPLDAAMRFELIGADDQHVYMLGHPLPLDRSADAGGLYRAALEGGTPEKVAELDVPDPTAIDARVVVQPGRVLVSLPDRLLIVPRGTGPAQEAVSSSCRLEGFAADGDEAFLAVVDPSGAVRIVRTVL